MRKLTAVITTLLTALAVLVIGGLVSPASANVTSPANGATLRGNATLAESGGFDDSTLDHCSWFGGSGGDTRLQLINSGGTVVFEQFWNTGGSRSVDIDTHNYANGTYTVRGTITVRKNGGILGLGCSNETRTSNITVTIDNITATEYTGDTTAPQNTSATVSAKLTDPNLAGNVLAGRTITFSLSGSATTVNATTNAQGIATASLPINGPPRNATVTASFAQTSFYKGSSQSATFVVTKNSSSVTIANPAVAVHGQTVGWTATVAAANGTGTPGGTVQFTVDGVNHGAPVNVVGGVATSPTTSTLSTGSHTIGAVYSGDSNFFGSTASTKTQQVNKASTTTVLTSTGSPTVSGQGVTFSAKVSVVSPGTGQPGGTVQFNVDGAAFGPSVNIVGDTATLTIASLTPGHHTVDATYNGNADYASSSSAALTHSVNKADTTLNLSTSNPNAVAGEPLTFTADVSVVAPGSGNPTGGVQFAVDGVDIGGPVPLTGGSATSPVVNLDAGNHVVTANYAGDANFAGANDTLTQVVDMAQTTTTVSSSPNPSVVGQPVTIRAEVTANAPATGTPEGAARIIIDGVSVAVVDLVNGVAEYQTSTLSVGNHSIQARYLSEDPNFVTSTSQEQSHTVNKAATKTEVTTSGSPSVFGQPVTFTATVSVLAPGAGNPSGTITFKDGSTVLGTQPVSSATGGQASITVSTLSVAQHAITAEYDGDDSFLGSNGSVTQKVNRAQTSTLVTSSVNPSQSGQGVTFTATVSPVAPGAGLPTGTVRFSINGAPLGAGRPLVNGVATSPEFASLTPGIYKVSATYSGDGNFVASDGLLDQGAGQNVTKGATDVSLSSDDPVSAYNQAVTFTATVDAVAPATRRPTGVVQFWEGGVLLGATSLEPGATSNQSKATFVTTSLTTGSHSIRAVYVGNFNYNGGEAFATQTIEGVPTVTGIESSANPITYGDDVTLRAIVSEALPASGAPTGSVTFTEGSNVLGTGTIATDGQGRQVASITVSGLNAGNHVIVATYSGDSTFSTSTSAPYTQSVGRASAHLEAQTILREIGDNGGAVRATLTGLDGEPLVGQTITFDSTGYGGVIGICSDTTDADGFAACDTTAEALAVILFNTGYDAHWAGNANYLPADDHETYFYSGN